MARSTIGIMLMLVLATAAVVNAEPTIVSHVISAEITPRSSRLVLDDQFTVEGIEGSSFEFLFHRDLEIKELNVGDRRATWRVVGAEEGDEAHVVRYRASLPASMETRALVNLRAEGTVMDSLHPPSAAYARSFETTTGLIEGRGAYLDGGTCWLPTIPGSLFEFKLLVTVPDYWESVSQGALESRTDRGGMRTSRWESSVPNEEVYLIAGPYRFYESDLNDVAIYGFLYEADDAGELWETYVPLTSRYIDLYEAEIGSYPFPKFAIVENFWQTGYGMPSFTLLGSTVIRLPFIPYTSYRHEILHNWWGNGVYVDWEAGNWCEGLTSYGADHAYKEERSAGSAASYRRGELRKYLNYVQDEKDFPLNEFRSRTSASTQAVGYSKATMVFHMLRRGVGEVPFKKSLAAFYKRNRFQVSSWREIRESFETVSGQNLETFFEQWVEREGAPVIGVQDCRVKEEDGHFLLEGRLTQERPCYELEVPVRIEWDGGSEDMIVILDGEESEFHWEGRSRPVSIGVDPEFDLFRRLYRAEIPAALSQTLGAEKTLIIISSSESEEKRNALRTMIEGWGDSGGFEITDESEVDTIPSDQAVWLFGDTRFTDRFAAALPPGSALEEGSWNLDGELHDPSNHSLVLTVPHPATPDLSWSLFLPADATSIPSIGRKIPHYGKYGYLAFDGDQNVAKGEWPSGLSPMRVDLR